MAITKIIIIIMFFTILIARNGSVYGKITDKSDDSPLIGANVIVEDTFMGGAADIEGQYTISNVPPGTYTFTAKYIGYEQLSLTLEVLDGKSIALDFALTPAAIRVKGAQVTGIKRQDKVTKAPASVEIISNRDIRRQNTTNIGSYLKGLKGVDFTASGINNYSISIRGFNSSFSSRLLTLTDGRIANIPALRVINYSTIPQSTEDVEKIEVVLGPATALYGANAHSGVINISSKSPADSEGLTMNFSGSNDDRDLKKISGRWAKKYNDFSVKVSASYLHAWEWEYISEREYKAHSYPWVGFPGRATDGKDNNPWGSGIPTTGGTIQNAIADTSGTYKWGVNIYGDTLLLGDGEPNHGDLDGDGVAGEDWYNGVDDDGDGLIDEDYFFADNIDNSEPFSDSNGDGLYTIGESFEDWNSNGIWDDSDGEIDEKIDLIFDEWYDGYDNDGTGGADDAQERVSNTDLALPKWAHHIEEENIILYNGRNSETIHGNPNPWYDPEGVDDHLRGDFIYSEDDQAILFDTYFYDYGEDNLPGDDAWIDTFGDGVLSPGESGNSLNDYPYEGWVDFNNNGICDFPEFCLTFDFGMDGIPNTGDYGEGNGIWDSFDLNGNGIRDYGDEWVDVDGDGVFNDGIDQFVGDTWPLENGVWDVGEILIDCGQDGLCLGDFGYPGPDFGENDGILVYPDNDELDGIFDTGDGCFGCEDDYQENFQVIQDTDGDGINDYPDFEVDNRKVDVRLDYRYNSNLSFTFQSGYSYTKTQQVTGIGRYIADGWESTFYQWRTLYKKWFFQAYINKSHSGETRGYNLGDRIIDQSSNLALQLQHNDKYRIDKTFATELIWGVDYFRTMPKTFGTILNDGPNGYDNDGDNIFLINDGLDNDNDGEIDEVNEGIDEPDEFGNVDANEFGVYYQSSSLLTRDKRWKLITAARLDHHDQLSEEGLLFGPKIGVIYEPNERKSWRMTYGKAFNTPTTTALFTDIYLGKNFLFDVYSKGNLNGTPYARVSADHPVHSPGYSGCYNPPGSPEICPGDAGYDPELGFEEVGSFEDGYFDNYSQRVEGAPFFFNISDAIAPTDWIALDTSRYLIFVPEINGDGVLYTPDESHNIPDVDPLRSESLQTFELGYKGFINNKTFLTFDYYVNYYENFFSPATIITPTVVMRYNYDLLGNFLGEATVDDHKVVGLLPADASGSNPPYGTAWNGIDDDDDWETWSDDFGWGDIADPGEWGFVAWNVDSNNDTSGYVLYEPWEVFQIGNQFKPEYETVSQFWEAVGVDEYHKLTGLNEAEMVPSAVIGADGTRALTPGTAYSAPHIVLSSLNYGKVWIQGLDLSFTHFLSSSVSINGNFSWYNSTNFYNELTKKHDPINAPKYKWTIGAKWETNFGSVSGSLRHVDSFEWSDGLWIGTIGPYNILNIHTSYKINHHLTFNISGLNLLDDFHRELIGGAKLGRQFVMRLSAKL
jgi:outer membrane receptor protein involved in Fe transport